MAKRGKFGILISGTGSNMKALVQAAEQKQIPADVSFVGSDNPRAPGLEWARERGFDTFVVDYEHIMSFGRASRSGRRDVAESDLRYELWHREYDLLCLAGFMRLLSPKSVDELSPDPDQPRIMNIHPALLPAFPGTDGYGDTWRYGCKVGGCTVHFVDHGEDTGPIIDQLAYHFAPADTPDSIRAKGLELEHWLYPRCVERFFCGRLSVRLNSAGRRVVLIKP